MRIDLTTATSNAIAEAETGAARAIRAQQKATQAAGSAPKPAPAASPQPSLPPLPVPAAVSVSLDSDRNTIYRFIDPKTGDLIRQIPPEEVLRIMRNIQNLLQQSQRKLEVTL
jgi:hypothetical protein